MLAVMRAIFLEFQLFLDIAPVLAGGIVTPFALSTLKRNQFNHILFTSHFIYLF
jgi:hypothetical protein